mmetsp:Transcript_10123/g.28846  ORF Transcript_10123/g.28846 Transcript_10123/m.28846 type:complete len:440 (+) Transcript_10123:92-1411(+)
MTTESADPKGATNDETDNTKEATEDVTITKFGSVSVKRSTPKPAADLPLDWTKLGKPDDDDDDNQHPEMPLRFPHDVTDNLQLTPDEIVLVGTAGLKITHLGNNLSNTCTDPHKLQRLVFRSHMIHKMEGLAAFTNLELLELYDNQIEELADLEVFASTLRTLDMSYNVIREISPVSCCENLTELYLANNKIKTMTGISTLTKLRKIDLGANRIRVIEELSNLIHLEELWLGKNKIEMIQGLETLTKLRRLDVQSNRLTTVENLETQLDTLEELYLAHNGINDEGASQPTGLALKFPNLIVLDLSRNELTSCNPFTHLESLEELWISGNKIESFDDVEPLKQPKANGTSNAISLETVYLEYNPVAKEFEYRKRLAEWIPSLKQIDATMIGGVHHTTAGSGGFGGIGSNKGILLGAAPTKEYLQKLQDAAIQRAKAENSE